MDILEAGKILSEESSQLLRDYTGIQDRADISADTGVGLSTLRDITFRTNSISERSLPAVKKLLMRAVRNADATAEKANAAMKDLKAILDTI